MKTQEQLEAIGQLCVSSIKGVQRTGIELVNIRHGACKFKMPLKGNENHVNMMYAGSLFSLAELPGGALFLTIVDPAQYYPVVGEVTIRYLKPATTDITVEVTLTEEEINCILDDLETSGKCKYVLKQELKDEKGDVVAITQGTYMGFRH